MPATVDALETVNATAAAVAMSIAVAASVAHIMKMVAPCIAHHGNCVQSRLVRRTCASTNVSVERRRPGLWHDAWKSSVPEAIPKIEAVHDGAPVPPDHLLPIFSLVRAVTFYTPLYSLISQSCYILPIAHHCTRKHLYAGSLTLYLLIARSCCLQ